MKASIIILNWNGGADDCIESVNSALSQDYLNKEILFVDNDSTDGSVEAIEEKFANEVTIIHTGANLGCPGGRNYGVEKATGDIIFFLENDGYWEGEGVVSGVIDYFRAHRSLGVLYTKVVDFNTGVVDKPLGFALSRYEDPGLYLSSSFRGGACACRRELFVEVGLFPADFFRQREERFVSLGVLDKGYDICYCPDFVLQHKGSMYSGKSKNVLLYNCINDLKIVTRRYPVILLPLFVPLKTALCIWYLYRGEQLSSLGSVLKSAFFDKPSTQVKRISVSSLYKFERLTRTRNKNCVTKI